MKNRVCLILEGSYPYITGGVSAWTHDLIVNLPEIDFTLYTISPEPDQKLRYELPPNVKEHKDIVVNKHYRSAARPRKKSGLLRMVRKQHKMFTSGDFSGSGDLLAAIPENYYMYRDAAVSDPGWQLLVKENRRNNPTYPFTDYFWAWKSAHDMLFTVLGSSAPEADIYHAVSTGFAGIAAAAAAIRRGRKLVLTEHGLYHKEREMEIRKSSLIRGYQRDMWIRLYTGLSRICYNRADLIISLFEENRRKQIEMGAPAEKTRVIPNGIDIERFSVAREKKEGFHIGLVGRVVPIKDIKTFIATARIVCDRLPDTRFYCIGPVDEDPSYYEDCNALVKSFKLDDRFEFTGRRDVRDYYKFLDVLALTSVREAQPLVLLEGYCAGIPAVATAVGNVPELLDYDERFIAPPKDAEKLAEGIIYIREHPAEIKAITESARKRTETFYDKKDLHRTYLKIYEGEAL